MYNFLKKECDNCSAKGELILGYNGSALCKKCHKEEALRKLFELENNRKGAQTNEKNNENVLLVYRGVCDYGFCVTDFITVWPLRPYWCEQLTPNEAERDNGVS